MKVKLGEIIARSQDAIASEDTGQKFLDLFNDIRHEAKKETKERANKYIEARKKARELEENQADIEVEGKAVETEGEATEK